MDRPDNLVLTLARIVRRIAEREARETAERRARLRVVEDQRGGRVA